MYPSHLAETLPSCPPTREPPRVTSMPVSRRFANRMMNRFRTTFANRHVVLPIVHVRTRDQALRNLRLAREAGADGAFLLSHGEIGDVELLAIHQDLVRQLPEFWLGVNCLGLPVEELF